MKTISSPLSLPFVWIGLAMTLFSHNSSVPAAILLPSVWSASVVLGIFCLFMLFFSNLKNVSIPVFFGILSLSISLSRARVVWVGGLLLSILLASFLHKGDFLAQVSMRLETWQDLLKVSLNHPFMGHGFTLLSMPIVLHQMSSPLPSAHSDWIALAFHGGWLSVVAGMLLVWRVCFPLSQDRVIRGIQCSILSFSGMALMRNTADQFSVIPVLFGLLVWYLEESHEKGGVYA